MLDLQGAIREVSAEQTLGSISDPSLWRLVGLTRLADITYLDHVGVHTFVAVRPNAKCLTTSQGKGITRNLAKVSALMEAIEIWHAEELAPPAIRGSVERLSNEHSLIPLDPFVNQSSFSCGRSRDIELDWVAGRSLTTGHNIFVPQLLCTADFTELPREAVFLSPSTNGLASGNSPDEALCHALFEIIERDAEAKHTFAPWDRHVTLKSIQIPYLKGLIDSCLRAELAVYIFDLTSDVSVPTYRAILCDREYSARSPGTFTGTGTHLRSDIALSRALTEAIQSRLTVIGGSRDDLTPAFYKFAQRPLDPSQTYFRMGKGTLDFVEDRAGLEGSFAHWVKIILARLAEAGMPDAVSVVLTRPNVGIPVVRVIVPGAKLNLGFHSNKPRVV